MKVRSASAIDQVPKRWGLVVGTRASATCSNDAAAASPAGESGVVALV